MSLRLGVALPLISGLGLMCLALQTLIADAVLAPSASVLTGLQHLHPERKANLTKLAGDLHRSLALQETPAAWSSLGLVLALQAEAAQPSDRPALADNAATALRASLRIAPANPYVWTRLALVRETAGAPQGEVLSYLRLSWQTGPNEERLRSARIDLALRHWSEVTPADRSAIFEDIRNSWAATPEQLLPLARTPFAANVMRAALLPDIGHLAAFEKALAGARR